MSPEQAPGQDRERKARERAAYGLRAAIRRAAVDGFGAAETEVPMAGFAIATRAVLDDPLCGVRAALLAQRVAFGQMREYAEAARGAGRSWAEIGAALGLPGDDEWEPVAGVAFEWLIEGHEPDRGRGRGRVSFERASAWWTCGSCGGRVVDRGPFESHPDDNESGHDPGCARHRAAVRAFERARGDL